MLRKSLALQMVALFFVLGQAQILALQKPKDDLKRMLKEKYPTESFVEFVQDGLYTGEYGDESVASKIDPLRRFRDKYQMSVEYYHLYNDDPESVRKFSLNKANPLPDGKTYQHQRDVYNDTGKVSFKASPITPLEERLRVLEVKVDQNRISFFLRADQLRHGGAGATTTRDEKTYGTENQVSRSGKQTESQTMSIKGNWGVEYHFIFPKEMIEQGDFDRVFAEINKVLLPSQEASAIKQKGAQPARGSATTTTTTTTTPRQPTGSPQNVEIKPGMTKQAVIKALGQPDKVVTFGDKEMLKYPDLTVVLVSGKVTDIR